MQNFSTVSLLCRGQVKIVVLCDAKSSSWRRRCALCYINYTELTEICIRDTSTSSTNGYSNLGKFLNLISHLEWRATIAPWQFSNGNSQVQADRVVSLQFCCVFHFFTLTMVFSWTHFFHDIITQLKTSKSTFTTNLNDAVQSTGKWSWNSCFLSLSRSLLSSTFSRLFFAAAAGNLFVHEMATSLRVKTFQVIFNFRVGSECTTELLDRSDTESKRKIRLWIIVWSRKGK